MALGLDDMRELITALALIALIGGAVTLAMDGFWSNIKDDGMITTNASVTLTAGVGNLPNSKYLVSVLSCRNSSGWTIELDLHCNVSSSGVVNVIKTAKNNFTVTNISLINYTHYDPNYQYNITENGLIAEMNVTDYLDTIGTIIGIAVLLSLVISAFYLMRR